MSEDTPIRRSTRSTRRTSKFTDDAFAGLDIELDQSESSHDSDIEILQQSVEDDFSVNSNDDEDSEYNSSNSSKADSEDGGVVLLEEPADERNASAKNASRHISHNHKRSASSESEDFEDPNRGRGIKYHKVNDRVKFMSYLFGKSERDQDFLKRIRERFYPDIIWPSTTLDSGENQEISASLHNHPSIQANGQEWYDRVEARNIFERLQISENTGSPSIGLFDVLKGPEYRDVLLNGVNNSRLRIDLGTIESLDMVWPVEEATDDATPFQKHDGWLLNIGRPVQWMEWVPNRRDSTQFLVLTTQPIRQHQENEHTNGDNTAEHVEHPNFPSVHIQFWLFSSHQQESGQSQIDSTIPPRLRHVIRTDWGAIRQFQWCPIRNHAQSATSIKENHLGLLATVYEDGKIRILDIELPHAPQKSWPTFAKISKVAFEAKPQPTLCTCLTWLSSDFIATGCANGFVAIYNLEPHVKADSPQVDPLPSMYESFHTTSIWQITSCLPSHPGFVVTSAGDGYMRLTDLRNPTTEFCTSLRARVGFAPLVWSENTQHIIAADDSRSVRGYCFRMFWHALLIMLEHADISSLAVSPLHSSLLIGLTDGTVSATNPLRRAFHHRFKDRIHKQVWFDNEYKRRQDLPGSGMTDRSQSSQQDALEAQHTASDGDDTTRNDNSGYLYGLIRLQTDYELQDITSMSYENPLLDLNDLNGQTQSPVSARTSRDSKSRESRDESAVVSRATESPTNGSDDDDEDIDSFEDFDTGGNESGMLPDLPEAPLEHTVYERESAVVALAWNPNQHVGGWAAAALGSGLLIVEDLSI